MATEGYKRKISAILSADVAGYSRLMEDDESATVRTVKAYRETIIIAIKQHRGKVIDSPGDNILSEFASVVDAVQCAVEIQQVIKAKNADLPENRKMEFRIGINLGDVIEEEDRIYGDGINIASRIEGIADAGGICISSSAYEQVATKLALGYEDLGEHTVKNITTPVHVYRIPMDSGAVRGVGVKKTGVKRFQWVTLILVGLIAGIGAVTIWNQYLKSQPTPEIAKSKTATAPAKKSEPSRSEKPSIAVLPFDNMSNDPEQEYFSDGISEDILNGLAKIPGLDVIARTSSFRFKGQNQDIRNIGKQLNATHILEGSVRKSGNQIRVTAQLVNTDKGTHLWSEQYDRELADVFEVQDEIAGAILEALNIQLLVPDIKQVPTANMEAYNAYLIGRHHANLQQLDKALEAFEEAVALDPDYADAYGALALTHNTLMWWSLEPASKGLQIASSYVDRAVSINPVQLDALLTSSDIQFVKDHAYQDAIDRLTDLARKYPNNVYVLTSYGYALQMIGRFDLAYRIYDRMLALDPLSPLAYMVRGLGFARAGQYQEARQSYEKMEAFGIDEPVFFAELAFNEGDAEAVQEQLDRGRSNWGNAINWYSFYETAVPYLNADHTRLKERLALLKKDGSYMSYRIKSCIALLEGDSDLAMDYLAQALSESDYSAFRDILAPILFRKLYPAYRSHTEYQKMLSDVGLDRESIAELKIPPLPF